MLRDIATTRRFTAAEVLRMVDAGILDEHEPVELIEGALVDVSPQGSQHSLLSGIIRQRLERLLGPGFSLLNHSPLDAGEASLPEPDVSVIRGTLESLDAHPTGADVALVVEVSVTSHALDRAKAGVYARAGVPVYWHVDVPARRVTAYTEPVGGEYRSTRLRTDGETIGVEGTDIPVADLLPPA